MKKAISFLMALVYLVFLTGNFWSLQESEEEGYVIPASSYSFNLESAEQELPAGDLALSEDRKHKHAAHLGTAGKVKVPRASLLLLTYKKFCNLANTDPHTFAPEQHSVVLYHADLFIRHGVLRI